MESTLSVLCATGVVVAAGIYWFLCVLGSAEVKGKRAVDLGCGSIAKEKVEDKYRQYWSVFRNPKEIDEKENVPSIINTFYDLVTDIYEWGWGQSFHFSPAVKGKSYKEETRIHEVRAVDLLNVKPRDRILDVGCGVGGPMRSIAAHSGASIVGITINQYQVQRAKAHNKKAGLAHLCEVVNGNFLQMPFAGGSFDGAYAIEATCHAPRLEEVYGEVFRVLKPGALFVTYEWVTTPKYRPENPEHVDIICWIEKTDALPGLRSSTDVMEVARKVGFEVVKEEDFALPPALPWWTRLKVGRVAYRRNHIVLTILEFLRIAPKGVVDLHSMLLKAAAYLIRGGETGIFTPMQMVLLRKPLLSPLRLRHDRRREDIYDA